MTKLHEKFNTRAIDIWNQHGAGQPRIPSLYSDIKEGARLVIVGMNPSFNLKWTQAQIDIRELAAGSNAPMSASELFAWDSTATAKVDDVLRVEAYAQGSYGTYFNPLVRFADSVGCKDQWQHLDLFLMRQTYQKLALRAVEAPGSVHNFNEFGIAQLELFVEILHDIGPDVVVIANATAAQLALRARQVLALNPVVGEPATFTTQSLPDTRFFMSGMFSGQRAMDNYAKERLVAQVNAYLKGRTCPEAVATAM